MAGVKVPDRRNCFNIVVEKGSLSIIIAGLLSFSVALFCSCAPRTTGDPTRPSSWSAGTLPSPRSSTNINNNLPDRVTAGNGSMQGRVCFV